VNLLVQRLVKRAQKLEKNAEGDAYEMTGLAGGMYDALVV